MTGGVSTMGRSSASLSLTLLPYCGERKRDDAIGKRRGRLQLAIVDTSLFSIPVCELDGGNSGIQDMVDENGKRGV